MPHKQIYDHLVEIADVILGKGASYGSDLLQVGQNTFADKFDGVYSADTIPKTFTYVIANLDKHDKQGSHWVALAKTSAATYMVYDSFGRRTTSILPDLDIKTIDTAHDAEQNTDELNCGARCIAWLIMFDLFGETVAQTI